MKFIIETGMLNERIKQGIKKAVETASKSRLVWMRRISPSAFHE